MIFKKWRKQKWQHQDVKVRLAAIDELSESGDSGSILESLLAEDSDPRVRKKALLAIETPSLLTSISLDNQPQVLVDFAEERIQDILIENKNAFSDVEKQDYYQRIRTRKTCFPFLLQWLALEPNESFELDLAQITEHQATLLPLFQQSRFSSVQLVIVDKLDEQKLLSKLLNKTTNEQVITAITDKLEHYSRLQEMPVKIRKSAQLLLSQLLALREQQDPEILFTKYEKLDADWQKLKSDFHCLVLAEQDIFINKHQQIIQQLKPHLDKKNEQRLHDRMKAEREQQIAAEQQQLETDLTCLQQVMKDVINNQQPAAKVGELIDKITDLLSSSMVSDAFRQHVSAQLKQANAFISKTEDIQEQIAVATRLISQISELKLPVEQQELLAAEQAFYQWQQEWQVSAEKTGIWLPETIATAAKSLIKQWTQALKPLQQKRKDHQRWFKQRFAELQRLAEHGKYRAAIAVFRKISKTWEALSDGEKLAFTDDYQSAVSRIEEIKALESFVVVPRKQQLIEQLQLLVDAPLTDVSEQAVKVKEFRKRWLALGRAKGDLEGQLNQAFNRLCENAFAPCREFYAAQAKTRTKNLATKEELLIELTQLSESINDADDNGLKKVGNQLNQLQLRWKQAGEVDRDKYRAIQERFNKLAEPIQAKIGDLQRQNADAKQAIINKAEKTLMLEDVEKATVELKQLQQQWQSLGFAGHKQDNLLWRKFRAINDQVFSNRDVEKKRRLDESTARSKQYKMQLTAMSERLDSTKLDSIREIRMEAKTLLQDMKQYGKSQQQDAHQVKQLLTTLDKLERQFQSKRRSQQYMSLFAVLQNLDSETGSDYQLENDPAFLALNKSNQRLLKSAKQGNASNSDRQRITLEMEIIANVDSPSEEGALRQQIQVAMLSDKLSGAQVNLDEKLQQWISCGPLRVEQQPLLARIKPLFIE